MAVIYPVSFTSNTQSKTSQTTAENKEKVQDAATAVGGTGFAAEKASRFASRRGLQGEKAITEVMDTSRQVMEGTGQTIKEANTLLARFKRDYKMFVKDAQKWFNKWENTKYLGKFVNSEFASHIASAFGGVLAVFVLISGVSKAAENGVAAFGDLRNKYHQLMDN